jgi:hypothetical protein
MSRSTRTIASFNQETLSSKLREVKKCSVRVRILKPYKAKCVNFVPGEVVWISQKFADELILADAAEYPEEQIDIEIERIHRENPEAVKANDRLGGCGSCRWSLRAN